MRHHERTAFSVAVISPDVQSFKIVYEALRTNNLLSSCDFPLTTPARAILHPLHEQASLQVDWSSNRTVK